MRLCLADMSSDPVRFYAVAQPRGRARCTERGADPAADHAQFLSICFAHLVFFLFFFFFFFSSFSRKPPRRSLHAAETNLHTAPWWHPWGCAPKPASAALSLQSIELSCHPLLSLPPLRIT